LNWYKIVFDKAKAIAQRQGYEGVRWQKMTDNEGRETPSSVGALLIWQEPHVISFAELCYRNYHNKATLDKYKELVFATADFMASFAYYDPVKGGIFWERQSSRHRKGSKEKKHSIPHTN